MTIGQSFIAMLVPLFFKIIVHAVYTNFKLCSLVNKESLGKYSHALAIYNLN
jgi:hypothetical protein